MKKIVFMFALVASVFMGQNQAQAHRLVDENSSWEEILRTASLKVVEPKEVIGNNFVSVFDLCVDEAAQLVRGQANVCVERRGPTSSESQCVREETRTVTKPLVYIERFCAVMDSERGCQSWGTYQAEVKRTHLIPVYEQTGNGQPEKHIGTLAFKKKYELPTCN